MQNLILNRYRPLDVAGKGGYGTVQVAWDMRIQRRVAIKCLRLDTLGTAATPSTPRDIPGLDEARTAAMLSDPCIVGVYDFEVEGPMAYLIMEYMDGITLTELMRLARGPLPLDVLTCVFESVAHAIEVAHENQVLHLDIKPDNVLINRQGQVKVADFGLAQLSHEAGFGQAAGGTIGYMPLEQMRLEAPDVRTDEWALAALTYQMLTGDNPFLARDLAGAERAIEEAEIVIPSLARGDVGEEVDEAVFGALAIDRADRFESVTLFAEAMMPHLGDARRGAKELAVIVGEACADEEEEAEDGTEACPPPCVPARPRRTFAWRRGDRRRHLVGARMRCVGPNRAVPCRPVVAVRRLGRCGHVDMAISVAVIGGLFPHRRRACVCLACRRHGGEQLMWLPLCLRGCCGMVFHVRRLSKAARSSLFGCGAFPDSPVGSSAAFRAVPARARCAWHDVFIASASCFRIAAWGRSRAVGCLSGVAAGVEQGLSPS
ncbi:MAG: serine/threonine-protein kinase [Slackia sp.]